MGQPSRVMPHVDQEVEVVHLGAIERAVVVAVDGRSLEVVDEAGRRQAFDLHPRTARWVRRGEPSFGTRLRFGAGA